MSAFCPSVYIFSNLFQSVFAMCLLAARAYSTIVFGGFDYLKRLPDYFCLVVSELNLPNLADAPVEYAQAAIKIIVTCVYTRPN